MADHRLLMSEEPEGWSVIPRGGETLRGKRQVCFYVHGYNSSPRQAKKSFDQLIANVRREAHVHPNSSVPVLDGSEAWRVYWPAYARLALDRSVVSALTYPLHVKAVGEWAEVFATFLDREFAGLEATPVEVTFVAHSLGCRFILETLRLKRQYNQRTWTIRSIILMAAAVPVGCSKRIRGFIKRPQIPGAATSHTRRTIRSCNSHFASGRWSREGFSPLQSERMARPQRFGRSGCAL